MMGSFTLIPFLCATSEELTWVNQTYMIPPALLSPLLLSLLSRRQHSVHQPSAQHTDTPHLEFAGVCSDECCCRRVPSLCGKNLLLLWLLVFVCLWAGWPSNGVCLSPPVD